MEAACQQTKGTSWCPGYLAHELESCVAGLLGFVVMLQSCIAARMVLAFIFLLAKQGCSCWNSLAQAYCIGIPGCKNYAEGFVSAAEIASHTNLKPQLALQGPHQSCQVWKVSFWMKLFGGRSPKRTVLYANSRGIRKFLRRGLLKHEVSAPSNAKLVKKTISKAGRKQFTGDKALKSSQTGP